MHIPPTFSSNEWIKKFLKQKDLEIRINQIKENEEIAKSKLDEIIENEINKIKLEINLYKQLIFELVNQKTYNKATNYINTLKQEYNNFPKILQNF